MPMLMIGFHLTERLARAAETIEQFEIGGCMVPVHLVATLDVPCVGSKQHFVAWVVARR